MIADPMPVILDVDTGIDDSLALLYACASPESELVAVTCVAGNIDLENVQRNTRAVLELAGRADVEVALGADRPLVRPLKVAAETHGPRGLGYAELPEPSRPPSMPNGRRPARRGGAPPPAGGHARRRRPADQRRRRAPARAGPADPRPSPGHHGWRLPRPRQHHADDGMERELGSRGDQGRLRCLRRAGTCKPLGSR